MGEVMGERFLDHQCGMTSHQECIETCGIPRAPAALPSHRLFTEVAERAAAKETFVSLFPRRCRRDVGDDDDECERR
jgi:hypothetical protein